MTKNGIVDFYEIQLDDFRPAVPGNGVPPILNFRNDLSGKTSPVFQSGRGETVEEFFRRQIKNNVFRIGMIQFGIRVQNLSVQLVKIGLKNLEVDLLLIA